MICRVNQLTGFYMTVSLASNELISIFPLNYHYELKGLPCKAINYFQTGGIRLTYNRAYNKVLPMGY